MGSHFVRSRQFALVVLLVGLVLAPTRAMAVSSPFEVNIVPIVGYSRVQRLLPTPSTINRFFYGALVTAGVLLVSAELQYTHGIYQESVSGTDVSNIGDRLKLGVRSGFRVGPLLNLYLRAGGEASQETTEVTTGGVKTTTVNPITYRPYAGAGGRVALTSKIYATADVVAIIPNLQDLTQTEFQATAGLAIRFP